MAMRAHHRGRISALVSTLLHALLLVAFALTSIRIVSDDRQVIPPVIRNPPPPPPPPGVAGAGPAAPVEVASQTKFMDAPKPIEVPKPVEKPKIAARPTAKKDTPRRIPPPAPAIAAAPAEVVFAAVPGGDAASGVGGGVMGGVAGGQVGGKVGGRLGGTGDDVWSVDQVATPPKGL